jgi:hypothetical protein
MTDEKTVYAPLVVAENILDVLALYDLTEDECVQSIQIAEKLVGRESQRRFLKKTISCDDAPSHSQSKTYIS